MHHLLEVLPSVRHTFYSAESCRARTVPLCRSSGLRTTASRSAEAVLETLPLHSHTAIRQIRGPQRPHTGVSNIIFGSRRSPRRPLSNQGMRVRLSAVRPLGPSCHRLAGRVSSLRQHIRQLCAAMKSTREFVRVERFAARMSLVCAGFEPSL